MKIKKISYLDPLVDLENDCLDVFVTLENDDCYDFSYSHLGLEFILSERKIIGFNELYFQKQCPVDTFLLSLVDNFIVDSILLYNEKVQFLRKDDKKKKIWSTLLKI